MRTILGLLSVLVCACQTVGTAERPHSSQLLGLRSYGGNDETRLPIVLLAANRSITGGAYASSGDAYVTVDFDIDGFIEPQLKIIVVHCSRGWQEDWDHFEENFMHLQTTDVRGMPVSPRIRGYGYHYSLRCPDPTRRITLDFSGNYKVKIIEAGDTLGEARLFAVDPLATITTNIYNEIDNIAQFHPVVHSVEFNASFAPEVFPTLLEGIDCVVDHRVLDPRRIDPGDTSAAVHVDESGPMMRFTARNIVPGNAYRLLDISDPNVYPSSSTPLSIVPRDIVRTGVNVGGDYHGSSILNGVSAQDADYVPIRFRFDANGKREREIFIVGEFNHWHPDLAYQMDYDAREHSYVRVLWLKRGAHEYQYVLGTWDPRSHRVVDQNWFLLEGNAWGTRKQYTALAYYRDPRFGGIDRIVGCGQNL